MLANDWCIHTANLFYLASFLGRDILWLRVLTCFGLAFGVIYFSTCMAAPMHGPIFWHVAFLLINFYQIHVLIVERRRMRLSREQEVVRRGMLEGLSDQELLNTLARAVHENRDDVEFITDKSDRELSDDERAFRDIALVRLSRKELVNLLSRRVWTTLKNFRVP